MHNKHVADENESYRRLDRKVALVRRVVRRAEFLEVVRVVEFPDVFPCLRLVAWCVVDLDHRQ